MKNKKQSMVHTLTCSQRTSSDPIISFKLHFLSLPLQYHVVRTRSRSFFNYFFLIWSSILKLCIRTKPMKNWFLFFLSFGKICSHYSIKSGKPKGNRSMRSRCRFDWMSFFHLFSLFFMFFNPKLMSSFIHLQMLNFIMRIIGTHSRHLVW